MIKSYFNSLCKYSKYVLFVKPKTISLLPISIGLGRLGHYNAENILFEYLSIDIRIILKYSYIKYICILNIL